MKYNGAMTRSLEKQPCYQELMSAASSTSTQVRIHQFNILAFNSQGST